MKETLSQHPSLVILTRNALNPYIPGPPGMDGGGVTGRGGHKGRGRHLDLEAILIHFHVQKQATDDDIRNARINNIV